MLFKNQNDDIGRKIAVSHKNTACQYRAYKYHEKRCT